MKLTPLDIRHREFRRALRGYADEEVDLFLDEVADEFERLYRENIETMERIERLEEQVSQFDQLKETLQHTLVTAQKQADDVKANARKEAELMLRDAELKGRDIMADSYGAKQRVEQALIQLRQVEEDFRFKFRSLLEAHINLLTEDDASEDRRRFRGFVSQVEEERAEVEAVEPETDEVEAVEPDAALEPNAGEAQQPAAAAAEPAPPEPAAAATEPVPEEAAASAEPADGKGRGLEWDAPVEAGLSAPAVAHEAAASQDASDPKARAAFAAVVWDTPVATEGSPGGSGEQEMPTPIARAVQAAKEAGGFDDDVEPVYERDDADQAGSPARGSLFGRKDRSREAEDDPFAAKEPRDFEW